MYLLPSGKWQVMFKIGVISHEIEDIFATQGRDNSPRTATPLVWWTGRSSTPLCSGDNLDYHNLEQYHPNFLRNGHVLLGFLVLGSRSGLLGRLGVYVGSNTHLHTCSGMHPLPRGLNWKASGGISLCLPWETKTLGALVLRLCFLPAFSLTFRGSH